ncbi:uncharacterized protein LOC134164234 [Pezoporus occidentalis]|uniref:uncharacterized protein LOC134164234 n=1 Tax=Pezoporus occidentalis TaxID=407982 RepID=UPI002F909DCC
MCTGKTQNWFAHPSCQDSGRASALFAALWQYESTYRRAAPCSLHALVSVLALGMGKNAFRSLCYPSLLKSQSARYESQLLLSTPGSELPLLLTRQNLKVFPSLLSRGSRTRRVPAPARGAADRLCLRHPRCRRAAGDRSPLRTAARGSPSAAGGGGGRNLGAAEPFPAAAGTALRQDAARQRRGGEEGPWAARRQPLLGAEAERGPRAAGKYSLWSVVGAGLEGSARFRSPPRRAAGPGSPQPPPSWLRAACEDPGAAVLALVAQTRL